MFEIALTVFCCLAASAFCSVTEASFYSVPPSTVEVLEKQKKFTARYLKHVKDNIDRYIASVLVVNTVANTVGSLGLVRSYTVTSPIVSNSFHDKSPGLAE